MPTHYVSEAIARVCHEANRGYQAAFPSEGIPVAPPWDEFPPDQQQGVINGVDLALSGADPQRLHEAWCEEKFAQGWLYGPVKDTEAKRHPCLVMYEDLPQDQLRKDFLFQAIVQALR